MLKLRNCAVVGMVFAMMMSRGVFASEPSVDIETLDRMKNEVSKDVFNDMPDGSETPGTDVFENEDRHDRRMRDKFLRYSDEMAEAETKVDAPAVETDEGFVESDAYGQNHLIEVTDGRCLDEGYLRLTWDTSEAVKYVRITVSCDASFPDAYTENMPNFGESIIQPWNEATSFEEYYVVINGFDENMNHLGSSDTIRITNDEFSSQKDVSAWTGMDCSVGDVVDELMDTPIAGVDVDSWHVNAEHPEGAGEGKMSVADINGDVWEITVIAEKQD